MVVRIPPIFQFWTQTNLQRAKMRWPVSRWFYHIGLFFLDCSLSCGLVNILEYKSAAAEDHNNWGKVATTIESLTFLSHFEWVSPSVCVIIMRAIGPMGFVMRDFHYVSNESIGWQRLPIWFWFSKCFKMTAWFHQSFCIFLFVKKTRISITACLESVSHRVTRQTSTYKKAKIGRFECSIL